MQNTINITRRFEEEQRTQREKEAAKLKKAQAMREVLEAAERLALEERKNRRKREEHPNENIDAVAQPSNESSETSSNSKKERNRSQERDQGAGVPVDCPKDKSSGSKSPMSSKDTDYHEKQNESSGESYSWPNDKSDKSEGATLDLNLRALQVPVSKEVAIVLSGRLEDPEILSRANLQLVNLVMSPSPRRCAGNAADCLTLGLNAFGKRDDLASSRVVQNRLLTPSKYRSSGRDFGTQTDVESDLQELRDKLQDQPAREQGTTKERKETTNASRRNIEK